MRPRLVVAALLASPPAFAQDHTWMLIADGSTDPTEAAGKLAAVAAQPVDVTLAAGYPRVLDSATVPGLKPGFHVVVLGACADEATAKRLRDLAKLTLPGTYLREVTWPEACVAIAPDTDAPTTLADASTLPLLAGAVDLVARPGPVGVGCLARGVTVELEVHGVTVQHVTFEPECADDPEYGGGTTWALVEPTTIGGRPAVVVEKTVSMGDNASSSRSVVGLRCGALRTLLDDVGGGFGGYGPDTAVRFADAPDGVTVSTWMGMPPDPDADPPSSVDRYTWDASGCTLRKAP